MTTIITTTSKGAPLIATEMDANFSNLVNGKIEDVDTRSTVTPTLNLDFTNNTLDPRINYSRASTGTYYDGKSSVKAEENLFTYSQQINSSYWNPYLCVFTPNSTTSPD